MRKFVRIINLIKLSPVTSNYNKTVSSTKFVLRYRVIPIILSITIVELIIRFFYEFYSIGGEILITSTARPKIYLQCINFRLLIFYYRNFN